jgi:hypothetical protein
MPTLVVTITVPQNDRSTGIQMAQTLREIIPVIETQVPLQASWTHPDRITRQPKATWTVA